MKPSLGHWPLTQLPLHESVKTRNMAAFQRYISSASTSAKSSASGLRKHSHPPTAPSNLTLTHLNAAGEAHMVSIAHKKSTSRSATAISTVLFSESSTFDTLSAARLKKGDALAVARIAGIQAAKKTADLIPLAHPSLNITAISIDLEPFGAEDHLLNHIDQSAAHGGVKVTAKVDCEGKTGVEMEALTAAQVAGLTIYDMLKGIDKGMVLTGGRVVAKSGGKSGDWRWSEEDGRVIRASDNEQLDHSGLVFAEEQSSPETSSKTTEEEDDVQRWNRGEVF